MLEGDDGSTIAVNDVRDDSWGVSDAGFSVEGWSSRLMCKIPIENN